MRSELETVKEIDLVEDMFVPTSAEWTPTRQSSPGPVLPVFLGASVAAILAIAGNTATTYERSDWLDDHSPTTLSFTSSPKSEESVGRRVSRTEALAASRAILDRAEQERLVLAENESRAGIQWDE